MRCSTHTHKYTRITFLVIFTQCWKHVQRSCFNLMKSAIGFEWGQIKKTYHRFLRLIWLNSNRVIVLRVMLCVYASIWDTCAKGIFTGCYDVINIVLHFRFTQYNIHTGFFFFFGKQNKTSCQCLRLIWRHISVNVVDLFVAQDIHPVGGCFTTL